MEERTSGEGGGSSGTCLSLSAPSGVGPCARQGSRGGCDATLPQLGVWLEDRPDGRVGGG